MTVHQTVKGRTLLISIDRPDKRNAVDASVTAGIDNALNRLDDDPDIWAGVLTGTMTVFSAGTDLQTGSGLPTPRGGEYGIMRRRRSTPLIAAVEGWAAGGGFEIALACDLIVASTSAVFALPEVRRGVIATAGALFRAPRALPLNVAREMLLTGASLDAERGYAIGLINRLANPGEAVDVALTLARDICGGAPISVRESLAALQAQYSGQDDDGWIMTENAWEVVQQTGDRAEGVAAFLEKRQPEWRNR